MTDSKALSAAILESPLARRFLLLFVLAAVVPAAILSLLSYYQFSGEVSALTRREAQQQTKQSGLMLREWLLEQRTMVDEIADAIESGRRPAGSDGKVGLITVRDANALETVRIGNAPRLYDVDRVAGPFVHEISRHATTPDGDHVIVSASLPGLVSPYRVLRPTADYCYLNHRGTAVQCSKPVPEELLARVNAEADAGRDLRSFVFLTDTDTRLVSTSQIFMDEFGLEDWTILVWRHNSESVAAASRLKEMLLPLIALFALIGLLLGMFFSRRHLTPLRQLMAGSQRLAKDDFDVHVEINGGDEFHQLGRSFNRMATRLKKKFGKLSILSEIDRLILSSQTLDHIGEVLLSRIDLLLDCDVACIWFAENDSHDLTTIIRDIAAAEPVTTIKSGITSEQIQGITGLSGNLDLSGEFRPAAYLAPLSERGVSSAYAVTIPVDTAHVATFVVGSKTGKALARDDIQQLMEFTNRAAVALSNSVWRGKLYYQAHFDILTQLPNRRMFKDILDAALSRAQREHHSVGVLFVDLDEFKVVNDSLGHAAGDDVLVVIGDRLRNAVRASDTVARLGGDEFVVIVPDLGESETHALIDLRDLGEKLLDKIAAPITVSSREVVLTASIGASFCPRDAQNADDLLRNADAAMYAVKERGRRGFRFYSDELDENAAKKVELRNEIAKALEQNQFELYYQPKVDGRSGRIVGCEALIRWHHPTRGLVGPDAFIREIERSGAIIEVGYWSLNQAVQQLAAWQSRGFETLSLSTNISSRQFYDRNLVAEIRNAVDASAIRPQSLELEITETAACADFERALGIMNELRELGPGICLDNFGTGHSSLQYVQRMPLRALKIDRSFVREVGVNSRGEMVIDSILGIGRSMQLEVTAEGVENKDQLAFLRNSECHLIQGFYYSEPVSAEAFEDLLKTGILPSDTWPAECARHAVSLVS